MHIRPRLAEIDPQCFWAVELETHAWTPSVEKYRRLAALAAAERDGRPAPKAELRALAQRWPACLREAELIGPSQVRARQVAAERAQRGARRSRAELASLDESSSALCLWRELHLSITDLLRFRAQAKGGVNVASFSRSLTTEAELERWPSAHTLAGHTGPRLRARTAYLWLCARAGLSLPELHFLLFARAGHWDARTDDPGWARGDRAPESV